MAGGMSWALMLKLGILKLVGWLIFIEGIAISIIYIYTDLYRG